VQSPTSKKALVIDLDGTICSQEDSGEYHRAYPVLKVIFKVNELWTRGWDIIIYTARGMKTFDGDVKKIEDVYREETEKWLKDNRVMYTKLIFGKPSGDVYVDDKGKTINEFVYGRE
jgi:capsule biosynthesis phosphatase